MTSTVLSSLGEAVLHRNSLATLTVNWIVIREAKSHQQILVSIDSISAIKSFKTSRMHCFAWALGSLFMAVATTVSKQSDGATIPFALVGLALLIGARANRQASLALIADSDVIRTVYGTLAEAATLVTAIHSTRGGSHWGERPAYELFIWWRAYVALLV
jgi:hypothetical protein